MTRQAQIFILTHFYPLFIAFLLYRERWDRTALVLIYTVPIAIVIRLFWLWKSTSNVKLNRRERIYINYLILTIGFYNFYCLLTIFTLPKWVYNHNGQASAYLLITLLFYLLSSERQRGYQ